MNKVNDFFEHEKLDSFENLFLRIDSFLSGYEDKNLVLNKLIKLCRDEIKNLEKAKRKNINNQTKKEIDTQIKELKIVIESLNKKIEKSATKKDESQHKTIGIKSKIKNKKEKSKNHFSEETLTLVNKFEKDHNLDELSIDQINSLIKYYRYQNEKIINLKVGFRSKKDHKNLDLLHTNQKKYNEFLKQLSTEKNKKLNEKEVKKIKKEVNKNFKLPVSLDQLKKIDSYCNIDSVSIINSIKRINDEDIDEKLENIYNLYLKCKEDINRKQISLISDKRKIQSKQKNSEEDNILLIEINNKLNELIIYINVLNNVINYLKPYQKNKQKNNELIEQDMLSNKQKELLEHMKLQLDISFNNMYDIIEAYKTFIRNSDLEENNEYEYIIKLSNFILQKLETMPISDSEHYKNMVNDCLKYKKLSIPKENLMLKNKLKTLQDIWKQNSGLDQTIQINHFDANYKEQIKQIIKQTKIDKEEAYIIWLECIEEIITKCNKEQIEFIINNLALAKQEINYELFQEKLNYILNKYSCVFENYLDIYVMNMNIPKDKQLILNNLKELIKNQDVSRTSSNSYKLFSTIIFEEKNISSLKRLLSLDPKFINTQNYDGTYLLENILDLLVNQIINDKYYFLENVFLTFLKYGGIYMDQELKNNLIRKIKDTNDSYKEQYNLDCILSNLQTKLDNIPLLDELRVNKENVYMHEKNKTSYKNFTNMLNRTIITIDQNDTKYFENAISCDVLKDGNYQIGIYVSDVVDCLNQDLIIESNDLRHKEYKTSANRYNKHILKEGKVKFALAFTFITDEELNVIDFKVDRARIRVKKNYTIEEAIDILDEGDIDDKQFYVLQRMNNVARKMYRKRNPKNYLKKYMEFIPEIQREFTHFVNRQVAIDAASKELPLIYKNQLPKNSCNLYELLEEIYKPSDRIEKITEIIYADKVSSYSTINRGNDYFNGEEYTQVTSPTRELASLLNQILIIHNYIDKEYINEEQKESLEKTLMLINHFNLPKE